MKHNHTYILNVFHSDSDADEAIHFNINSCLEKEELLKHFQDIRLEICSDNDSLDFEMFEQLLEKADEYGIIELPKQHKVIDIQLK